MTYEEHERIARGMDEKRIHAGLASLATDERFAAVVAWLEFNKESFTTASSAQSLAGDHGKLAHAAGSCHAVRVMRAQLVALLNPSAAAKRGPQRPPEE